MRCNFSQTFHNIKIFLFELNLKILIIIEKVKLVEKQAFKF